MVDPLVSILPNEILSAWKAPGWLAAIGADRPAGMPAWPEWLALVVMLLAIVAESLHAQRFKRVGRLAFGPRGKPAGWTILAPAARVASLGLAVWGLASLLWVVQSRVHVADAIEEDKYKHLVLILDVSPSMHLKDAGQDRELSRRMRVSQILESVFNRVPMRQFKTTVIAVYTDAKPLLEDSRDHEVVRHIIERLPMWHAFQPGKTELIDGIEMAVDMARPWNPDSTYVLMLTDGDTVPATGMPKLPASVAEFIVVGVGDPQTGEFIDGHMSRQDINTLRQVSHRLGGFYHDGNQKHLPSDLLNRLNRAEDKDGLEDWTRREWALAAIATGALVYSTLPLLLHFFGTPYRPGVAA